MDSDLAQLGALWIGNAAHPIPSTSRERTRGFLRGVIEENDMIELLMGLSKRSRKEQVLELRSPVTRMTNISKVGTENKDEEDDQEKARDHCDDKLAAVLPSRTGKQVSFDEGTRRLSR